MNANDEIAQIRHQLDDLERSIQGREPPALTSPTVRTSKTIEPSMGTTLALETDQRPIYRAYECVSDQNADQSVTPSDVALTENLDRRNFGGHIGSRLGNVGVGPSHSADLQLLRDEISQLRSALAQRSLEAEDWMAAADDAANRLRDLQASLTFAEAERFDRADIANGERRAAELEAELNARTQSLDARREDCRILRLQVARQHGVITTRLNEVATLTLRCGQLGAEIEELGKINSDLRAEQDRQVGYIATLIEEIAALRAEIDRRGEAIDEWTARDANRMADIAELQSKLAKRDDTIVHLRDDRAKLLLQKMDDARRCGNLDRTVSGLNSQLSQERSAFQSIESAFEELHAEKSVWAEKHVSLCRNVNELEKANGRVVELSLERQSAIERLQVQLHDTKMELAKAKARYINIRSTMSWKVTSPFRKLGGRLYRSFISSK